MNTNIKNIAQIAVFTAVMCVISPLSLPLPITPVPVSLATFVIYIFSIVLGTKKSLLALVVYMLIGIVGFPVFSKGGSGIGVVLGPTGGYLIGYFFCALGASIGSQIGDRYSLRIPVKTAILVGGLVVGTFLCLLFGTIWLAYINELDFFAALSAGVIPFLPGDIVKIVISVIVAPPLRRRIITLN